MRRLVGTVLLAVICASCGGDDGEDASVETTESTATTSPPTTAARTTTTADAAAVAAAELEADTQLIVGLWRAASDAWGTGGTPEEVRRGYEFYRDNNYPGTQSDIDIEGCTSAYFVFREEHIVDRVTVERDDGWTVPGGPLMGQTPAGRIYIHSVQTTTLANNDPPQTATNEAHTVILDGRAYFFQYCQV